MTYYAEARGSVTTEDIHEGGILRYEKDSMMYCDLWRFSSKAERDSFVNESDDHTEISSKEARKQHKEQFNYWNPSRKGLNHNQ